MKLAIWVFLLMQSVDANLFLKFGMIERYPDFFLEKGNSTAVHRNYIGSWVYAIDWLSKRYNFTYLIISTGTDVGKSETLNGSGSWSGATGRLLEGVFDVLGPPVLMTPARIRVFGYAGIAEDDKSAILTPATSEESTILSTLRPFKPTVWVVSIIALLSVACFFTASTVINRNGQTQWRLLLRPGRHVLNALAILTNQGEITHHGQNRLSYRLVAAGWCIFALVMVNLYSSTLTSHISARKMKLPPNSSFQVAEEGVLDYLLLEYGLGQEMILGAKSGPLKKLGDTFRRRPENLIPDRETGFLKVASGCCAYSDSVSYLEYRTAKDFKETGKCRVHIGFPISGYGFGGLLVKKENPYKDMINLGVLQMYQTGLIGHWRNQFVHGDKASLCKTQNKKPKNLRRLNLYDLASAFFILMVGYIISILFFLVEQFHRLRRFIRRHG